MIHKTNKIHPKIFFSSLFALVIIISSFNNAKALESSTSCAASGHYSTYAAAHNAIGSACSAGVGYSRGYIERSTSHSWECTGWNGSGYVTTANCSVSWNADPIPAQPVCPTTTTTTPTPVVTTNICKDDSYYCGGSCILKTKTCGGCPYENYCDGKCLLVDGESCPFVPNPNIELKDEGEVSLNNLVAKPSIGDRGYSCIIDWVNDVFNSYNNYTRCTISTPTYSVSFIPALIGAPTYFTVNNIQTDTVSKMVCTQIDSSTVSVKDVVCRVNWKAKEVN